MARSKAQTEAGQSFIPHLTPLSDGQRAVAPKSLAENNMVAAQNILKVHDMTSPELRNMGRQWYPGAQQFAERIGKGDVEKGAGVIAAMSPQKPWDLNQRIAEASLKSGVAKGQTGAQNQKAQRIMDGEHPHEVLGALKERSFYDSIVNPHGDNPAIDRHAHDIAVGSHFGNTDRGLSSPNRYAHFQNAYRTAADHLGVSPNELQAVTWTGWRGAAG